MFSVILSFALFCSSMLPSYGDISGGTQIIYTSSGYHPDMIEVPVGTPVIFWNLSSIPLWTASDPHPIHTDFSQFDARRGYHFLEVYSFVFPSTGTYAYHNHEKSRV